MQVKERQKKRWKRTKSLGKARMRKQRQQSPGEKEQKGPELPLILRCGSQEFIPCIPTPAPLALCSIVTMLPLPFTERESRIPRTKSWKGKSLLLP